LLALLRPLMSSLTAHPVAAVAQAEDGTLRHLGDGELELNHSGPDVLAFDGHLWRALTFDAGPWQAGSGVVAKVVAVQTLLKVVELSVSLRTGTTRRNN